MKDFIGNLLYEFSTYFLNKGLFIISCKTYKFLIKKFERRNFTNLKESKRT